MPLGRRPELWATPTRFPGSHGAAPRGFGRGSRRGSSVIHASSGRPRRPGRTRWGRVCTGRSRGSARRGLPCGSRASRRVSRELREGIPVGLNVETGPTLSDPSRVW